MRIRLYPKRATGAVLGLLLAVWCVPALSQNSSIDKSEVGAKGKPAAANAKKATDVKKGADAKKDNDKSSADNAKKGKNKPAPGMTLAREAAAMAFVKQHHAELAELLVQLKAGNDKEYEKAIRELFRTSERLAQIRERDMPQYDLELQVWQAQSRVQLLSARVKMTANNELRDQLRSALNEQIDARIALLRRERERINDRVGEIDQQLLKMEENRRQAVNRQIEALVGDDKSKPDKSKPGKNNNLAEKKNPIEKSTKPESKLPNNSPAGS